MITNLFISEFNNVEYIEKILPNQNDTIPTKLLIMIVTINGQKYALSAPKNVLMKIKNTIEEHFKK